MSEAPVWAGWYRFCIKSTPCDAVNNLQLINFFSLFKGMGDFSSTKRDFVISLGPDLGWGWFNQSNNWSPLVRAAAPQHFPLRNLILSQQIFLPSSKLDINCGLFLDTVSRFTNSCLVECDYLSFGSRIDLSHGLSLFKHPASTRLFILTRLPSRRIFELLPRVTFDKRQQTSQKSKVNKATKVALVAVCSVEHAQDTREFEGKGQQAATIARKKCLH